MLAMVPVTFIRLARGSTDSRPRQLQPPPLEKAAGAQQCFWGMSRLSCCKPNLVISPRAPSPGPPSVPALTTGLGHSVSPCTLSRAGQTADVSLNTQDKVEVKMRASRGLHLCLSFGGCNMEVEASQGSQAPSDAHTFSSSLPVPCGCLSLRHLDQGMFASSKRFHWNPCSGCGLHE